jgi:hypothetical protein
MSGSTDNLKGNEMTTTISVPARMLRRRLTLVLPHCGEDDTLPALQGVRLEVQDGWLYLAATDRYTMAVARLPVPGAGEVPVPDQATLLPAETARALRRLLKGADGVAALSLGENRISADIGNGTTGRWPADDKAKFPEWRPMLAKMLAAGTAELGDGHGVDPGKLARFAIGADQFDLVPLSLRVTNGSSRQVNDGEAEPAPVLLVTRGDWFIGCLMPVRLGSLNAACAVSGTWDEWAALSAPAGKSEAA